MKKLMVCLLALSMIITLPLPTFATDENIVRLEENDKFEITEIERIVEDQRRELREMWDDYPAIENKNIIGLRYQNNKSGAIGSKGDILIALDSITDHVGIVVDRYTVIEAHPDNPNGGVDYRDNNWESRYNRIKGLYVDGASSSECKAAVNYADDQIGEPYSLTTDHWSEDKWYCSKLVWRAWYEQGYDIEGRRYEPRGTHVTPGDILDSPLTVVFYSS